MPEAKNVMVQAAKARALVSVSSSLLAAEADYLTCWGWVPHVVRRENADAEQPSVIQWRHKGEGPLRFQSEAVRIQKAQDPAFIAAETM